MKLTREEELQMCIKQVEKEMDLLRDELDTKQWSLDLFKESLIKLKEVKNGSN